jgi:hypothetical protein
LIVGRRERNGKRKRERNEPRRNEDAGFYAEEDARV